MEQEYAPLKIVPCYSPSLRGFRHTRGSRRTRRAKDEPTTKVRNACIGCREKKTRCSGHAPCMRCRQHGQTCQYMTTASPQPQPQSRIIAQSQSSTPPNPEPALTEKEKSAEEEPLVEEPPQEDLNGHSYGTASGIAFLQYAKSRLAHLPSMSIDFADYPLAYSGKLPAILPPRDVAEKLGHEFFDFGITTTKFVHEPSFWGGFERLYESLPSLGGQEDEEEEKGELGLIYMVLALGAHYSKVESVFEGFSASVRFYDMAQRELDKEPSKITLSLIQTRLLIIHYLLSHSRMQEAWSLFGIVVRHAQALRLQCRGYTATPNSSGSSSCIEREFRKRVFWTIYGYDRVLSSIFGRPCAIHDDDVDQEECALANDEDISVTACHAAQSPSSTTFCSAAALIHFAHLARILGRILREFYSPVRRRHDFKSLQDVVRDIETELRNSQKNLPIYLDYTTLPPSAMSVMTQRQMCSLKLLFAHASLLLYRPFILYLIRSNGLTSPDLEAWFKHCGDKSVEAANMVVEECQFLESQGLFSRHFWLVNYVQFAAIGTLYMHTCLWPDCPTTIRGKADEAMDLFPVGVEGDLVGQRYLEILRELRVVTGRFRVGNLEESETSNQVDGSGGVGVNGLVMDEVGLQGLPIFDDTLMNYGDPWGFGFLDTSFMDGAWEYNHE